jgi:tetratricopeptide (TPR) repeat protein
VVAFAARTATQEPVWRSNRDLVLWALAEHPESYRQHQVAARALVRMGDLPDALHQYDLAVELYPRDYYDVEEAASAALDAGRPRQALGYLRRSASAGPPRAPTEMLTAQALLAVDSGASALPHARRAVELAPLDVGAARVLAGSFAALGERDSALAVCADFRRRGGSLVEGWLLQSSLLAGFGDSAAATAALDSARRASPADSAARSELRNLQARGTRAARAR